MEFLVKFLIIEASLLCIPILAGALYQQYKNSPKYKILILSLSVYLIIYFIFIFFSISFFGDFADLIMLCLLYFTYSNFIFRVFKFRKKIISIPLFIISLLPIAIGYLASTIGMLGLMFTIDEYLIIENSQLSNKIYYRKYRFGNATTDDGGYNFEILKTYNYFPIEKLIAKIKMDGSDYSIDSLKVKFNENGNNYKIQIFSNDSIQIDTLINK